MEEGQDRRGQRGQGKQWGQGEAAPLGQWAGIVVPLDPLVFIRRSACYWRNRRSPPPNGRVSLEHFSLTAASSAVARTWRRSVTCLAAARRRRPVQRGEGEDGRDEHSGRAERERHRDHEQGACDELAEAAADRRAVQH